MSVEEIRRCESAQARFWHLVSASVNVSFLFLFVSGWDGTRAEVFLTQRLVAPGRLLWSPSGHEGAFHMAEGVGDTLFRELAGEEAWE